MGRTCVRSTATSSHRVPPSRRSRATARSRRRTRASDLSTAPRSSSNASASGRGSSITAGCAAQHSPPPRVSTHPHVQPTAGTSVPVRQVDLFDPDDGGSVSEKERRELELNLYNEMQRIDSNFLRRSFDVPLDETFAGSAFAAPSATKAKWKEKLAGGGAQKDEADASVTGGYPLTAQHALAASLTQAAFDELSRLQPPADGFTLRRAMQPALSNPGEEAGMVAGSPA
eukprot:4228-Prymnesium_polylepis.1